MKKIDVKGRGFTFLTALFFAIVFWVFVIVDSNPTRITDIRNVPIEVRGKDALSEKGLVLRSRGKETCTVRMEGTNSVLSALDAESVNAYIDVSKVTGEGEYKLSVQAVNTSYNAAVVKSVSAAQVTVEVDRYVEKEVPVEVQIDGDLPEDSAFGKPTLSQERVKVSGASKDVDAISRAVCRLPVDTVLHDAKSNAGNLFEASINLEFYGETGQKVEYTENKAVIVSIEVLAKKKVPVNVSAAAVGRPAAGYAVRAVTADVTEVQIAGKREAIDAVTEVSVGGVNVSGARQTVSGQVSFVPVEGIEVLYTGQVTVTVEIGEEG